MNSVALIGRLTREPDVRYTQNGTTVARFSIAIDSGFGDNKRTDFPNIVCFGKTAEICERYLGKGSQVGVTGRLQTGSYDKNGVKVYTTEVVADRVEFLQRANQSQPENHSQLEQMNFDGFSEAEDDIPF